SSGFKLCNLLCKLSIQICCSRFSVDQFCCHASLNDVNKFKIKISVPVRNQHRLCNRQASNSNQASQQLKNADPETPLNSGEINLTNVGTPQPVTGPPSSVFQL